MTHTITVSCDVEDCRYNDRGKFPRCSKNGEIRVSKTFEANAECMSYKKKREDKNEI